MKKSASCFYICSENVRSTLKILNFSWPSMHVHLEYLIFTTLIVGRTSDWPLRGTVHYDGLWGQQQQPQQPQLSSLTKLSYGSGAKSSAQSFVPSREILFHAVTCQPQASISRFFLFLKMSYVQSRKLVCHVIYFFKTSIPCGFWKSSFWILHKRTVPEACKIIKCVGSS